MKITEILGKRKPIFSCEFFPPKTDEAMSQLFDTVRELKVLNPGYVSVTYGAGGGTREKTVELVRRIKKELGIEVMAHLTCVGHSRAELKEVLDQIQTAGIDNVMALRGDPPKGETEFKPHPDGFNHAAELADFIRQNYKFCVAVAGYPEGHVEAPDKETDWKRLLAKVKAGGDLIITQLFFDNRDFFAFEKRMREKGVNVPIIPGIMPITNLSQIVRFTQMCGAKIPEKAMRDLKGLEENPETVADYGVRHAAEQCKELLELGVPGIHFYTLNKSKSTRAIIESLKKSAKAFAGILLALCITFKAAIYAASADAIFLAMEQEMTRSKAELKFENFGPPYFIVYQALEAREITLAAGYGALTQKQKSLVRYAFVQVRYGNYDLDSSEDDDGGFSDPIALEDSPEEFRHRLWLLTDRAYKRAVKGYLEKQGKRVSEVEKEKLNDFSKEKPLVAVQTDLPVPPELDGYSETLKSASAILKKFSHVLDGGVSLRASFHTRYLMNSEGTKVLSPGSGNPYFIHLWASAQADDGMNLSVSRTFSAGRREHLPDEAALKKTFEEMAGTLSALRSAPVADPYTGPAILDPESTGVLFHEAVGHRLEGERLRNDNEGQTFKGQIGKAVIPSFLSVTDDPTAAETGGFQLNGHYDVDDEGVPAQKVPLVETGVLKNFLLSRRPVSGFSRSNGHGRAQFGRDPIGRMSNLFVESSNAVSREQLKTMLLEECRAQKKPYGLIIRRTRSGDTYTGRGRYQAFRGTPEEVFLVDAKTGEEKPVRGVEVVGTPLITVNKILATGKETQVLNAYCGAESGTVPVSTVAPWSLVKEIELQRVSQDKQRPPILPAPPFEKTP